MKHSKYMISMRIGDGKRRACYNASGKTIFDTEFEAYLMYNEFAYLGEGYEAFTIHDHLTGKDLTQKIIEQFYEA